MFDFLRRQFIDVIEWLEEPGQVAWRVPFADQAIQHGAQLTVREGQAAAFVNEGRLADWFGPGLHTLETANLPLLTSLMNWDKGFHSPFKSDVVFVSLREQAGLRWGTAQPVTVRDAELGALRLRAFGTCSFRVEALGPFLERVVGTLPQVQLADLEPQLRAAIQTALATALGASGLPFLDLAGNQQALSETIGGEVDKAFAQWGLKCLTFHVESVSLPDEVQAQLDKGSAMRVVGDMGQFTRFQAAQAIEQAAGAQGGVAGVGAGLSAGLAAASAMGKALGETQGQAVENLSNSGEEDPMALIEKLHRLLTLGAISQAEFDAKKAQLLARIG